MSYHPNGYMKKTWKEGPKMYYRGGLLRYLYPAGKRIFINELVDDIYKENPSILSDEVEEFLNTYVLRYPL